MPVFKYDTHTSLGPKLMSSIECKDFANLFHRELSHLEAEIKEYSSESMLWVVLGGQRNSAGNITLHVCANLMHYISDGLGKSGYERDREAEFSDRVTRDELIRRLRECRTMITSILESLDDSMLDEIYPAQAPERMGKITSRGFLLHLVWHLGWHLGQIYYHRLGSDSLKGLV